MASNWLLDSGASHDVTSDISNLSLHQPYEGPDDIVIGDGTGLNITHDITTGALLAEGRSKNNVYKWSARDVSTSMMKQACMSIKASLNHWHDRLGHPSTKILHQYYLRYRSRHCSYRWIDDMALIDDVALTDEIRALASSIKFAQQVFGAVAGEERPFKDYFSPLANLSTSCIRYPNVAVHKINVILREIPEFTQREDEQFFETWDRFNGLLLKCPHHGYEKWHQCQYFLEGLLPNVQEWLMATSGGELKLKSASEIWEFFQRQANNSQQRSRSLRNTKRIKKVNEVRIGESSSEIKEVKAIIEGLSRQIASLSTAKSTEPQDHDSYSDQANAISVMRKPSNYNPYSNTYNPGWRDHPNFSWSQGFQQNGPTAPAPPIP
ncbi:hypothetical protein WN943_001372 [Citrus x changshan-huyou]